MIANRWDLGHVDDDQAVQRLKARFDALAGSESSVEWVTLACDAIDCFVRLQGDRLASMQAGILDAAGDASALERLAALVRLNRCIRARILDL